MGSVAGLIGVKQRFAYCASKGAVVAITRQIAVDYPKELRVNCICPGTVDTPFVEGYLEKSHNHEKEKVKAPVEMPPAAIGRLRPAGRYRFHGPTCRRRKQSFGDGAILNIDGGGPQP